MYLMPCKKLGPLLVTAQQFGRRVPDLASSSRTDHELDASVRPAGALVAFDAGGRAADRGAAWNAGGFEDPSAFVRDRRSDDVDSVRDVCVWHAGKAGGGEFSIRRVVRAAEDCVDRDRGGVSVRHFGGYRAVRDHEAIDRDDHAGPAAAVAAGRVLFWSVHRRGGGIWRAGGDCRGVHDRAGFQTVSCGGAESDCEHRAGGLGRDWNASAYAGGGDFAAGKRFERDDRADPAVYGGAGAVLAGAGDGRLVGNFRGAAGDSGGGDFFRGDAVFLVELYG